MPDASPQASTPQTLGWSSRVATCASRWSRATASLSPVRRDISTFTATVRPDCRSRAR